MGDGPGQTPQAREAIGRASSARAGARGARRGATGDEARLGQHADRARPGDERRREGCMGSSRRRSPHHRRPQRSGSKQRELHAPDHGVPMRRKKRPRRAAKHGLADQAATVVGQCHPRRSPSWFSTSSPDSGTSPDVFCETMIFLAINPRQVICEEVGVAEVDHAHRLLLADAP